WLLEGDPESWRRGDHTGVQDLLQASEHTCGRVLEVQGTAGVSQRGPAGGGSNAANSAVDREPPRGCSGRRLSMAIVCKSAAEIDKMRRSGRIVREVLDKVSTLVKPGATTMDLEHAAERKIKELGAKPAFKGYYDYPCVLCTSINEEIVHGIPSEKRALKAGEIVSIDCGVVLDGYYGDAAITVPVDGLLTPELSKLLEVT